MTKRTLRLNGHHSTDTMLNDALAEDAAKLTAFAADPGATLEDDLEDLEDLEDAGPPDADASDVLGDGATLDPDQRELSEDPTLLQEPPKEFSPTLELPTPHHWRLVKVAIVDRISALKSIAKKVSDEGYTREARTMEHDALALSEDVAPQLETQAEIPLATSDEVQSGIANELRGLVRRHVRRDREDVDDEAILLRDLAAKVERYALDIADRAYAAGFVAREATGEVFALKSLNALR